MGSGFENYFLLDLISVLFGISLIGATAVAFRKLGPEKDNPRPGAGRPRVNASLVPWALMAYGTAVVLAPLSSPFPPRPLMSMPRFVLALFPLFGALGLIHHRARIPLALLSAGGLFLASAVYVASRPLF